MLMALDCNYRRHERVEYADGERSAACERLREVELRVGIVVVVLVQKLNVAIVDKFYRSSTEIKDDI